MQGREGAETEVVAMMPGLGTWGLQLEGIDA